MGDCNRDQMHRASSVELGEPSSYGPAEAASQKIVLIESRAFFRDCLSRSLELRLSESITTFESVADFCKNSGLSQARIVVLSASGNHTELEVMRQVLILARACGEKVPILLLSERELPNEVVHAMNVGVRGYITMSLSLDIAVEAIRIVQAGGIFAPAHSLLPGSQHRMSRRPTSLASTAFFTQRQTEVVNSLRRGKANKAIAYELNMRESTVKIHVRNIMQKLKARNRTEVAFLASEILGPESQ